MAESSTCDSRQYRFGYRLQTASDVPGISHSPLKETGGFGDLYARRYGSTVEAASVPPRIYILAMTLDGLHAPHGARSTIHASTPRPNRGLDSEGTLARVVRFHFGIHPKASVQRLPPALHKRIPSGVAVGMASHCKAALPVTALSETSQGITYKAGMHCRPNLTTAKHFTAAAVNRRYTLERDVALPIIPSAARCSSCGHNRRLISISTGAGTPMVSTKRQSAPRQSAIWQWKS